MTVFKSYLKIALFNKVTILIYLGIFFAFAIFIANLGTAETEFVEVKPNVSIFDNSNSLLSSMFIEYVEQNANVIEIDDDNVDDALFFRTADYIIYIPEDFENEKQIDSRSIPESFREAYLEILINRFLNIVDTYENYGYTHEEIENVIFDDMDTEVDVSLDVEVEPIANKINSYYNFSNYIILSLNIFLVSLIVKTFREEPILKRNLVSKVPVKSMNKLLLIGNLMVSFTIFLLVNILSLIIFKGDVVNFAGLFLLINTFAMSIASMMLGFLVGNFVKGKEARNGVVNVVGLGSSFISGAFVPQAMLASSVLLIAKFFPSYYFIYNNDYIVNLNNFSFDNVQIIYFNVIIIFGFALFFYILNNLFSKKKI